MLLIFQYVKSDEAVRIVARTGRKRLHKIGTAKRIPTIREPEKASDSCEDNANTKSGEAPDLPTWKDPKTLLTNKGIGFIRIKAHAWLEERHRLDTDKAKNN